MTAISCQAQSAGQGPLKAKGAKKRVPTKACRAHAVAAAELLEHHRVGGGAEHGRHLQAVAKQGVGGKLIGSTAKTEQGNAEDSHGKAEQLAATHPLPDQQKGDQGHHQRQQGADHARLAGAGVAQGVDLQQKIEAGLQRPHQGQPAPIPWLVAKIAEIAVAAQPAERRHAHAHEEHLTEAPDRQHVLERDEGAGPEQHLQSQGKNG